MNKILNFNNFYIINEGKDDSKMSLQVSEKLKKILIKIYNEPIARKIIDNIGNYGYELSYIDIDKDSKYASFITIDRIDRIKDNFWENPYRQVMTWGRLINKLFPNEFTNMDIDRFYNRYRPEIDVKDDSRFEIVRGEDIKYWYLEDNWSDNTNSCMRHKKCQNFFGIYTNNPEKCGLLIHHSGKNKIIGRALVWNNIIKPSGDTLENRCPYTFMDRVYTPDAQIAAAFQKYAIDNNWIYRPFSSETFLMNGEKKTSMITTRLKPMDYKYYPYVDTLYYYTPETGRASSNPGIPALNPDNKRPFKKYQLRRQDGGKEQING